MPVQAVDVNVHPAKTEVKFLSEREVFDAVHYAVLSTLSRAAGRPEWKTPEKSKEAAPQPRRLAKIVQPPKPGFYQTMQASEYRRQAAQQPMPKQGQPMLASPVQLPRSEPAPAQQSFRSPKPEANRRSERSRSPNRGRRQGPNRSLRTTRPKPEPVKASEVQQGICRQGKSPSGIIGEALHTYIIIEQGAKPFCSLTSMPRMSAFALRRSKRKTIPSWPSCCWPPVSAELSREEAAAVLENKALLSAAGLKRRTSAAETCSSGRSRPTWTWRTQRRFCRNWPAICWPEKRLTRTACATICCTPSPANRL